jgi:hypothetical protein
MDGGFLKNPQDAVFENRDPIRVDADRPDRGSGRGH